MNNGYAQMSAKVDEKFELTSIVFALAGVPEYCDIAIQSYYDDIIKEMIPYAMSEPIEYIRILNQNHMIGYAAVSSTASMLEIHNGKIRLQAKYDISKISEADSRWNEELFAKYIDMLNKFYKLSNFRRFFEKHRPLYELAEQRMNEIIVNTSSGWFKSFFGKELDPDMKIYINLTNGPHNYAIPGGVLIGVQSTDKNDRSLSPGTMYVFMHELCHHYTNPLFSSYWDSIKDAADKIYPHVKDQMYKNAYGDSASTMGEWLNDLFVLMYFKETNDKWLRANVSEKIKRGFIWMERSMEFVNNFDMNRDKYPTINEFMPQLVDFLNYTADNFEFVEREYKHSNPYITNIYPAPGSDITDVTEVIITFSEPMLGSYGFIGIPDNAEPLDFYFENVKWDDSRCRVIIPLKPNTRKQGETYGLKLHPNFFLSAKYFPLDDRFIDLIFKPTAK